MVLPASRRISRALRYSGTGSCFPDFVYGAVTLSGSVSTTFLLSVRLLLPAHNPRKHALWFGLFPVRSPLLRKSLFIFSSSGYLDVSVPRVPFVKLCIHFTMSRHNPGRVPPFGNLRIVAHLQLPAAYRSSLRPSSAYGALASTLRSL